MVAVSIFVPIRPVATAVLVGLGSLLVLVVKSMLLVVAPVPSIVLRGQSLKHTTTIHLPLGVRLHQG